MRRNNRTRLETVIPLETPFVVHIETHNICNFKCKFCTECNDKLGKKYGIKRGFMSYNTFCSIIDDMKEFTQKVKALHLYLGGEPLLHKDMPQMIKYAKESNVAEEVIIFSNGSLLTQEISNQLIAAGLDKIQFSIEGTSNEKYKEITKVNVDYDKLVQNIAYFFRHKKQCKVFAKILDTNLSNEEKDKFMQDFKNISDECYIETLLDIAPHDDIDTSLGNGRTYTQEGKEIMEKEVCTSPFYVMLIHWDGSVSPCGCGDWRRKHSIGNIHENSIVEIWHSKKWNDFRKIQLQKKRNIIDICMDCKVIDNQLDNIDDYAEQLLAKYVEIYEGGEIKV